MSSEHQTRTTVTGQDLLNGHLKVNVLVFPEGARLVSARQHDAGVLGVDLGIAGVSGPACR